MPTRRGQEICGTGKLPTDSAARASVDLMTKREWDAETRINYGCFMGARSSYRRLRGRVEGRDYLAERAWRVADLRCGGNLRDQKGRPRSALDIGSPFRAPQAYRARVGLPLLERAS